MLDGLTMLSPPTGAALRRAVVQPALKCGYRFEDEALVEEILEQVEHERGALPMLAFAAARLWEHRDRKRGVLTREAYEFTGGVGGALAQHAEATLETIGRDKVPIVRELFRNLVTSQGTRAARDREELLSIFGGFDRSAAVPEHGEPDVFLSYSRADLATAQRLARRLEAEGFTVWWDRQIAPGKNFDEVIERALAQARAVVVLWSKASVTSNWVKAEASEALKRGRLVPVLIEPVQPPLEFRRLEAAEIHDSSSEVARQEFAQLSYSLRAHAQADSKPRRAAMTDDRETAEQVLDTLIDARLLTSYEVPADDEGVAHHRIEIIHESLLSAWPRLVRWRTQDAEGSQLRDELRQAARMWEQHSRSEDLLWTGTAFREFQLWQERYPGGLTAEEEAFAAAMAATATRRRRRRRLAATTVVILALLVAAVTGGLWLRSEAETRRAEAARLLADAQLRREEDPTEALAYTTASLELADTDEARVFALRLLQMAPPALQLDPGGSDMRVPSFSPDGRRLAVAGHSEEVRVFAAEGGPPIVLSGHVPSPQGPNLATWASNELLATGDYDGTYRRIWSIPGGKLLRQIDAGNPAQWQVGGGQLLAKMFATGSSLDEGLYDLRSWRLPGGEAGDFGHLDLTALGASWSVFDTGGPGWVYGKGREVLYRPLPAREGIPDRLVGRHDNEARLAGSHGNPARLAMSPGEENRLWTRDAVTSELRLWDLSKSTGEPLRVVRRPIGLEEGARFQPDPSRRWAVESWWLSATRQPRLWKLNAWREARPLALRRSGRWYAAASTFHPSGEWFVVSTHSMTRLTFWPLRVSGSNVVDGYTRFWRPLAFSPDGQWLATWWSDNKLRLWPLPGNDSRAVKEIEIAGETAAPDLVSRLVFDPLGRYLFLAGQANGVYVVPLDGSPPRRLETLSDDTLLFGAAVSPSGRRVATAFGYGQGEKTLRVWDLDTGQQRLFDQPESASPTRTGYEGGIRGLAFADETTLYSAGDGGVRRWDLESGSHEMVLPVQQAGSFTMAASSDGRRALVQGMRDTGSRETGPTAILDLDTGALRALPAFTAHSFCYASLDASGSVAATSDETGAIRIGRVAEGKPHLLLGHEGSCDSVAISPDRRWIASTGEDDTLRLWPMPDLDQPPLHTLPLDELLAKLRSLTNIRVVRDPESAEGWKVEVDPFPGWEEVPTW